MNIALASLLASYLRGSILTATSALSPFLQPISSLSEVPEPFATSLLNMLIEIK
jgi:hypothetical protein